MQRRASAPPFNVDWIASSASRPRLFSPADVRPGETVPTRGAYGRPPCAAAGTGPHSAGGRPQAKKGSNATAKSSPWIGTWRHYCLTYVRRNVTLYVDGQRETSWNATVNTSASALYVGADVNGSHTLSGAVDEVFLLTAFVNRLGPRHVAYSIQHFYASLIRPYVQPHLERAASAAEQCLPPAAAAFLKPKAKRD